MLKQDTEKRVCHAELVKHLQFLIENKQMQILSLRSG